MSHESNLSPGAFDGLDDESTGIARSYVDRANDPLEAAALSDELQAALASDSNAFRSSKERRAAMVALSELRRIAKSIPPEGLQRKDYSQKLEALARRAYATGDDKQARRILEQHGMDPAVMSNFSRNYQVHEGIKLAASEYKFQRDARLHILQASGLSRAQAEQQFYGEDGTAAGVVTPAAALQREINARHGLPLDRDIEE